MRRVMANVVGVMSSVTVGVAMVPLRSHLSIATAGLVLVVPVVLGVVAGGFLAGVASVAAGFLVFDLLFIPPYGTLSVGTAQDWTALVVYAVVMVVVARVMAILAEARADSAARADNARRLFELSELMVANKPLGQLSHSMLSHLRHTFGMAGATLVVPRYEHLEIVASSGAPLSDQELAGLSPGTGVPVALGGSARTASSENELRVVALSTLEHPVGLLVLRGVPNDARLREFLPTLANQLALALERADLHERALRAEVLEEMDRLRQALVGAVSHDLRTPLATIKVASSTLLERSTLLPSSDVAELHLLIDRQTDRLNRLVTNLLDMTRLEAGVLEVAKAPCSVWDLVGETLATVRPSLGDRRVEVCLPDDLAAVEADHILVGQVLSNLLDNADRYAPPDTPLVLRAERSDDHVVVSVSDQGPGVPKDEREAVFERFVRFDTGGRAGLGLALAKTFVHAHGGTIWVQEASGGGACFAFTLPLAPSNMKA